MKTGIVDTYLSVLSHSIENFDNISIHSSMPLGTVRKRRTGAVDGEIRNEKKVGRNEACPCGSGKKYKKCCLKNNNHESK